MWSDLSMQQIKVRALITAGDHVLCMRKEAAGQSYLSLPGGTQEPGELLEETLLRECREELGAQVEVGELAFICPHRVSMSRSDAANSERLEFVFCCHLLEPYTPANGPNPDRHQREVLWLPIDDTEQQPCMPPQLPEALAARAAGVNRSYWPHESLQAQTPKATTASLFNKLSA
jgi:ADP-ribose pyrophosphatase YjhB (NUDIX family)